jgi:hypothetical protein
LRRGRGGWGRGAFGPSPVGADRAPTKGGEKSHENYAISHESILRAGVRFRYLSLCRLEHLNRTEGRIKSLAFPAGSPRTPFNLTPGSASRRAWRSQCRVRGLLRVGVVVLR